MFNSKTIALNMIVKNESHIIEKTLSNLVSYFSFSYWVICDTGSTDNTQNIIKKFFDKLDIKGELIEQPWKDFGYNRTLALENIYNKSDYVLIFDADDTIHGNLVIPELNYDMYHLKIGKNFTYKRPLLINNRLKWKFVGVLHEYLSCIDDFKSENIIEGDYYIESGKTGSRSLDNNKYNNDAEILKNAYEIEKDVSLKCRYAFYCAQSYMDANNKLESVKWYKQVIDSHNWVQEKYYSCLMISKQLKELNINEFEIIHYLSLAEKFDNERKEHIIQLCNYFYEKSMHLLVNSIYFQYKNNKKIYNTNDKLFLSLNYYNNKDIEYYNSISAYYIGNYESGYECCIDIICNKNIIETIENNKKYENETPFDENIIFNNFQLCSTINNLYFYKNILKNETNKETLKFLFLILNIYIKKKYNNNLFELWNIVFDKLNVTEFCKYKFYNYTNKDKPLIFLSITSCKRYDLFEKTINSLLNNWNDFNKIDYWFCVDDNSNQVDRQKMSEKYPFFEYYFKNQDEKGHRTSMNIIWEKLNTLKPKYWVHLEDDFLFFDNMNYVSEGIFGLEFLSPYNVKQILFNRCYSEIIEDYRISGFIDKENFCIHEYIQNHDNSYLNNHYWPYYSFRPSIVLVEPILTIGNFNTENQFFELDYANKWNEAGYKSGFLNKITNKHIGRLTKDKDKCLISNAYELNCENQFIKETSYIKVVNLLKRKDRKNKCIELFKSHNITNYEFIEAVDGMLIDENTNNLHLFLDNDFGNRRGFIGCALSHYNLWLKLLEDNENYYYLIMEDDIELTNNFKMNLYKFKHTMKEKEIIFFGYSMFEKHREDLKNIYNNENVSNIKLTKLNKDLYIGGAFCYSINKKGAKHMIDYINLNGIKHGLDYIMGKYNYSICYETQPQICFTEWNDKIGKNVDSNIQSNYESINILDILDKKNENFKNEFVFIKGKDQIGKDKYYKKLNKLDCMKIAFEDENCAAFNTLGFFKNDITQLTTSKYFNDSDGIYIKKKNYENFINKITKIYNRKEILRIKMICNWTTSENLCFEWSNLCETSNTWQNIEITHTNDDIDYYVIINYPYNDEYFEPSKTFIFQMEPWVQDVNRNWGVKCWREWSEPDQREFLYVGTHKKTLNAVQWQINIPKVIPTNRRDKIITILSRKNFDVGHINRINFTKYMEFQNVFKVDVYGRENYHNFKNYCGKLTDDKKENHYPNYKYCLAVENNMETNYATEKIWEPILCECLTFYWGCPNLETYIDERAFVRLDLNNFSQSMNIIIQAITEDWWSQRIEIIRREKLKIINELGFFPNIKNLINNINKQNKE